MIPRLSLSAVVRTVRSRARGAPVWAALAITAALLALAGSYPIAQHGMRGYYFFRPEWIGEQVPRIDPVPSSIGAELALGPIVPPGFSAYWTASLAVDRSGSYRPECTTNAWCRVVIRGQLVFDSRDPSAQRDVLLAPGIYPLFFQASTTTGRLDVDVWWHEAGTPPRPLRAEMVFPRQIGLTAYRRLAAVERLQRAVLAVAAAIAILLVVGWALGRGRFGWVICLAVAAAALAVHTDWPSPLRGPGPEEWQWPHRAGPFDRSLFAALATGFALLAGVAFAGSPAARRRPRLTVAGLIAGSVVVGLGFQLALLDTEPGGWQLTLVDRVWSGLGFLRSAALTTDMSVADLLARYPTVIPRLSLHATVHPPGATLLYRALAAAARAVGANADLAFALGSVHRHGALPLTRVALAGGVILAASAALTALPVALVVWLLRRDRYQAAAVALLWPFCPAPTIFSPTLVQLLALLVASVFALLLYAQRCRRGGRLAALGSGVIAGGSVFLSYGTVPMLAAAVMMCAYRADQPEARAIWVRTALIWTIGLLLATFAPILCGYPVVATAVTALRLHKEFTLTRSAVIWLGFNLVDFVMFFGIASLVVAAAQLATLFSERATHRCTVWRLTAIACGAILLLDLSGTSRGEVGRLWVPFMPLLFAAIWSAPVWSAEPQISDLWQSRDAVVVGALAMLYCVSLRLHWFVGY